MSLIAPQLATLKAAVTSDAAVTSFIAGANWFSIAQNYNTNTTSLIWRSDISPVQIHAGMVGSECIALSNQQLQLANIVLTAQTIDATNPTVRGQFVAIFSSAASTLSNLTALAQRPATKFESLFVAAQVSTVYGYVLSAADVQQAMS